MITNTCQWECDLCHKKVESHDERTFPDKGWVKFRPIRENQAFEATICGECVRAIDMFKED